MRFTVLKSLLILTLIAPLSPAFAQDTAHVAQQKAKAQAPQSPAGSFADMAEILLPAVVNISSTLKIQPAAPMRDMPGFQELPPGMQDMPQFPEGSPFEHFFEDFMNRRGAPGMPVEPEASLGSGFIIDAEQGLIVTNNHVVRDADEVRVTFHDDETIDAEIIGRDEKTDIAVLKVETDKDLTAVKFGDSDIMRVGDWIVAIGNPFGLGGTVTAGIVSARARDINAGPYDDFIQTDASINRGNSGGPMFNLDGEVIGINTAIFSPSGGSIGIGFAIPSALAKPIIDQIIQYGRTRRGWLGVRIQQVTDEIAESLGLEQTTGALIASVTEGGPSEAAGLQQGDIILELNGHQIMEMRTLPRLVAETPIESDAEITFWRDGKRHTTTVEIGELEKAEETGLLSTDDAPPELTGKAGTTITPPGFTLSVLNDRIRMNFGLGPDVEGVLITGLEPRSQAALKGLYEGDVIAEINQTPVTEPSEVKDIIEDARQNGRSSVLLLINRDGDTRFIAVKINDAENE